MNLNVILQVMQDSTAVAAPTSEKLNLLELMIKGGPSMIVLGLMFVFAVYIFIERFLTISQAKKEDSNFMNNIRDCIHDGRLDAANRLCQSTNTPVARMISKGLSRVGKPLNDITAAVENEGKLEVARLEKKIAVLATISGAGPMIGFLGTVTGMVQAFHDMSKAGNNIDISLLSSGIYEAMITTVGGLVVGIVAYICYNYLVARISNVVFVLESRTTEFIDVLNEPAN